MGRDEFIEGDLGVNDLEPVGEYVPDEMDDECGPPEETDMVDDMLEAIAKDLVRAGYSEEDAEDATFDAMSSMIEEGLLGDTPDIDEDEGAKGMYVSNAKPKIMARLREMGLDI